MTFFFDLSYIIEKKKKHVYKWNSSLQQNSTLQINCFGKKKFSLEYSHFDEFKECDLHQSRETGVEWLQI